MIYDLAVGAIRPVCNILVSFVSDTLHRAAATLFDCPSCLASANGSRTLKSASQRQRVQAQHIFFADILKGRWTFCSFLSCLVTQHTPQPWWFDLHMLEMTSESESSGLQNFDAPCMMTQGRNLSLWANHCSTVHFSPYYFYHIAQARALLER